MAATMVVTPTSPPTADAISCCPGCGYSLSPSDGHSAELLEAQSRISDLEAQIRRLNEKAAAAVDRWADYEDELTKLRAQQQQAQQQRLAEKPLPDQPETSPTRSSFLQASTTRISAMLTTRKSTPSLRSDSPTAVAVAAASISTRPPPLPRAATAPGESDDDLRRALTREQSLRREAEGLLTASSREMEELSATLFEQANEMVADERRARARLEERVGELERRDVEKRRRLERLEGAMGRIERVRALLEES